MPSDSSKSSSARVPNDPAGRVPAFVERMDGIDLTPTRGAERAVLLAALRWANRNGELWPSLENWANMAGIEPRSLRRILRKLAKRGIIEPVNPSKGGTRQTSRYRIPSVATNPDARSGFEPGPARPETQTLATSNPDTECLEPGHGVPQSTSEQPFEQPTTAGGVVARLSVELQNHRNLSPDRRAWIEKVAPTKKKPPGWARKNITEGWPVPDEFRGDPAVAMMEARWSAFLALPEGERNAIRAEADRRNPYFEGKPLDTPGLKGAIAEVMSGAIPASHVKESP